MNIAIAVIGALTAGTAVVILRHGKIKNLIGFITLSIIVAAGLIGATALIVETAPALKQPTTNYKLNTGEYLRCTPHDDNTLNCTVEKKENHEQPQTHR